jgi:shikimate dehydrogenase
MRTFGLIGHPLGHSFSREYFTQKFAALGLDAVYRNYDLADLVSFPAWIRSDPTLEGLNVTRPYKEQVIPFLDTLDSVASATRAVNTIRMVRDGGEVRLEGFNTDVYGFQEAIRPLLRPHHRRALILGTGASSRSVRHALLELGLACVTAGRTPQDDHLLFSDVTAERIRSHTLVINTTPLGMFPDDRSQPPIPYAALTPDHLLFDLVYNPPVTSFMAEGRRQGAVTASGILMLQRQADRAWEIWNGGVSGNG